MFENFQCKYVETKVNRGCEEPRSRAGGRTGGSRRVLTETRGALRGLGSEQKLERRERLRFKSGPFKWGGRKAGRTAWGAERVLTAQWPRGQRKGGGRSGRDVTPGLRLRTRVTRGKVTVQEESPQPVTFTCWAGSGAPKARRPGFGQRREHRGGGRGTRSGHVDMVIPARGRDHEGSSPRAALYGRRENSSSERILVGH